MNKVSLNLIIALLIILISFNVANAQRNTDIAKFKVGFIIGYGSQKFASTNSGFNNNLIHHNINATDEPDYQVLFFQFQFYYTLLQGNSWGLNLAVQPEYNITKYKPVRGSNEIFRGYETGINFGIQLKRTFLSKSLDFYIIASTGPHYVSGTPKRQANGFLFSDNFLIGLSIKISQQTLFDIRGGFRHISNAGLKNPNAGINNLILGTGIIFTI